ncbi:MAG TPA: hypothetical protein VLC53_14535 [Myxococcota bacterium]|nr:hypothetical protein [Myxococcota bacterium]
MRRPLAALAGLALAFSACSGAKQAGRQLEQNLNPFASSRVSLLTAERVGPYLRAQFRSGSSVLTFFAPAADDDCARLLRPEALVTYRKHGNFGRFEDGELRCDPVGVGSLAAWRDRRPRDTRDASIVPRAHASFREVERDGEVALVRGRFPLASRVGIPSGFDLIAMLPLEPACERPLARGSGALEFLAAGSEAFRIVGEGGPCPVLGFAIPPDAPASD